MNVLSLKQMERLAEDRETRRDMMHGLARATAAAGYVPDSFTFVHGDNEIATGPTPLACREWITRHDRRWFVMVMTEVEIQRMEHMILHPMTDPGLPDPELHPSLLHSQGGNGNIH
jgi:hypothetical protein